MTDSIEVLILEDRPEDAELMVHELRRAGFDPQWQRVDTEAGYLAHLTPALDVILADSALPRFDGLEALHLLQAQDLDIPFIVVSGGLGDEMAVEFVRQGAADYVLKHHLIRLGPAVQQALEQRHLQQERQQAVTALRESEERYRQLVESSPEGIIIHQNGTIAFINPAGAQLVGAASPNDVLGRNIMDFMHPDEHEIIVQRAQQLAGGETTPPAEIKLVRLDGRTIDVETRATPFTHAGQPAVQVILRDVSEQKRRERRLEAQAEQQAAVAQLGEQALAGTDLPDLLDEVTLLVAETLDVEYTKVLERLPDGDALLLRAGVGWQDGYVGHATVSANTGSQTGYTLLSGTPVVVDDLRTEKRFAVPPLLTDHDVSSGMSVIIQGQDRPFGILGAHTTHRRVFTEYDVHFLQAMANVLAHAIERRHTEEALRREQDKFAKAFRSSPHAMGISNLQDGQILDVNAKFLEMLGYRREDVIGRTSTELDLWLDPDNRARMVRQLKDQGTVRDVEFEFRTRSGNVRTGRVSAEVIEVDDEVCLLGIIRDVTEQKHREEQLRFQANVLDNVRDSVIAVDPQGTVIYWNEGAAEIFGYTAEEMLGESPAKLYPGQGPADVAADLRQITDGESYTAVWESRRKDGTPIWVDVKTAPMRDEEGRLTGFIGVSKDVTDRRQRELELEAIAAVATTLRTAATRTEMLPIILDQAMDLLDAEAGTVVMHDLATGDAVFELTRGGWTDARGLRLPADESIAGDVITTGQPYVSDDVRQEPRFRRPDLVGNVVAMAGVPLVAQEQTIGMLAVGRRTAISQEDVRILTAIADIAANAIQRATQYEATERRVKQLDALRTIDVTITASTDQHVTLRVILDQATAQLDVDAAAILALDPYTQTLNQVVRRGFRNESLVLPVLRIGEGHAGRAALERRAIHVPDLTRVDDFIRTQLVTQEDFRAYYATPLIAKGQVKGVLEIFHRQPLNPDPAWHDFLKTLAGQTAVAIDSAEMFENLQRSNAELKLAYDTTLEGWAKALELRDQETVGHSRRVTEMTLRLARALGMSVDELVHVRRGAILHDVGKMGISDRILQKPGPLDEDEWAVMRRHPVYAYELLQSIEFLQPALDIPYCHHEKWDGTGYPQGLRGEEIPLPARIFAVVDVYDALISDRPSREAWPEEAALAYIREEAGRHFDPTVVETFFEVLEH